MRSLLRGGAQSRCRRCSGVGGHHNRADGRRTLKLRSNPSGWRYDYVVPPGGGTIRASHSSRSRPIPARRWISWSCGSRETPGSYTVVGKTGLVTLAGTGLETFTANIPVQSGDILGFWIGSTFANCMRIGQRVHQNSRPDAGRSVRGRTPFPTNGLGIEPVGEPRDGADQQGSVQERRLEELRQHVQEPGLLCDALRHLAARPRWASPLTQKQSLF